MGPGTILPEGLISLKAQIPTPSIHTPQSIQYILGLMVSSISTNDLNTNGVPRRVTVLGPSCQPITYEFADNTSTGAPIGSYSASLNRLIMLDTNSAPTLSMPRYYVLKMTDLTEYLYGADSGKEDYKGLISFTLPYGRTASLLDGGIKVIRDEANAIRQISVPECLVDVVTNGPTSYEMRFYDYNHRGVWNSGTGLYTPDGTPFVTYVVCDPDEGTNSSLRTRISQVKGGQTNLFAYDYSEATAQWKLTTGGGLRDEVRDEVWDEDHENSIETHFFRDAGNNIVFLETSKHHEFPFGKRLVEKSVGDAGDRKTFYTYYEDAGLIGKYGRVKTQVESSGAWKVFDYNLTGKTIAEYSSWKDLTIDQTNLAKVSYYSYAPHVTNDYVASYDTRARTVVECVGGITSSIERYAYYMVENGDWHEVVEHATSANSSYGDTNNQVALRVINGLSVSDAAKGLTLRVEAADGKTESYEYEYGYYHLTNAASGQYSFEPDLNGDALRISTVHGTRDHVEGVAYRTVKERAVYDRFQNPVLKEILVYNGSGYERISWAAVTFNVYGKEEHRYQSDGAQIDSSWGLNCCGKSYEKDAAGRETVYSYDLLGRLVAETKKGTNSAADVVREYTYDAADRRLTETISNTNSGLSLLVSSNRYDLAGQMTDSTDALGIGTTYVRQDGGRIASTVRAGVTNTTEYYLDGRTKSVKRNGVVQTWHVYGVNADGTQWTKLYTGSAGASSPVWTVSVSDFLGRTIRQERPGFGGVVLTNTSIYNANGWVVKQTNPGQADTLIAYNELGERIRSGLDVNGDGALNLAGPDRVSDSETVYVKIGADWWQESRSVMYPVDNSSAAVTSGVNRARLTGLSSNKTSESISIDIHGNQTISTTAVNRDEKQVTQTVDYPDSTNDAVSMSVNGLLIASVTKTGLEYGFQYDGLERQIMQINPRAGSSRTHFNNKGQEDYVEDAASNRTYFGYSPTTGQRTITTNALGQTTRFEWDVLGQLVRTWGHAPYPVEYEYSDDGRMIGMKTYRGGTGWEGATWPGDPGTADETRWQYEPASGLLTNKLYADGNGTSYSYTPDGKLASRRWARGITTTYSFSDTTGELIGIDYSDNTPDVGFTYLRMGQQGTITDGEGTRTLTYDPRLQLSNEVQVLTGNLGTNIISRATDSLGRNTGFRLEQNESVVCESAYSYATDGRFNGVAWSNAGMSVVRSVQYQYLPQSELLAGWTESDAGFTTVREYEPQRDLLVTVSNRIGTNVVSVFGYQNDVIGRRTKRYDGGSAFTAVVTNLFGYNTRSELTNAVMGDLLYGFRFDNIGNREWSKTNGTELLYVANELNQYTQIANGVTNNPTYDLDGNLLTDGTWTNTWDGENRLVGVTPLNVVTGSKKLQMAYDYMGRRVRKAVLEWDGSSWQTNKTSRFVFDGWNLLSEYSVLPSSVQTNWFVWGLDLSGSLQGAGGIGGLISAQLTDPATSNLTTLFYTFDGNGNVSECLTTGGEVAAHYEYSPFAAVVASSGPMAKTNPFRFSTKWWDDETGLGWWGYRFYDSGTGRWCSREPIGEVLGSLGLYGFVQNSPISGADYLGLMSMFPGFPQPGWKIEDFINHFYRLPPLAPGAPVYLGDPNVDLLDEYQNSPDIDLYRYSDVPWDIQNQVNLQNPPCCIPGEILEGERGPDNVATTIFVMKSGRIKAQWRCTCEAGGLSFHCRIYFRGTDVFDNPINIGHLPPAISDPIPDLIKNVGGTPFDIVAEWKDYRTFAIGATFVVP